MAMIEEKTGPSFQSRLRLDAEQKLEAMREELQKDFDAKLKRVMRETTEKVEAVREDVERILL